MSSLEPLRDATFTTTTNVTLLLIVIATIIIIIVIALFVMLSSLSSSGLSVFPANGNGKENFRHESYTE
jgi:preprotein translocase subunit SecG